MCRGGGGFEIGISLETKPNARRTTASSHTLASDRDVKTGGIWPRILLPFAMEIAWRSGGAVSENEITWQSSRLDIRTSLSLLLLRQEDIDPMGPS